MSKHTPTKWKFSETDDYTIEDQNGRKIAEYFVNKATEEQDLAHARLIAAAPELLQALMYLSDAAEALDLENKPASDLKDLEKCLFLASKAIAKAEGAE